MDKIYYQVAIQGEGYRDDGAEDNPCAWCMVAETPTQLVGWLNDEDRETLNENGDAVPATLVWFRVLKREELETWSYLREVLTLKRSLAERHKPST